MTDATTATAPQRAARWVTVLGVVMIVAGVMLAFRLKPRAGCGWVLFDGVLSVVLAIMIAVGWPSGSIPVIGLLAGFALISSGVWRIMLARALRAAPAASA